MRVFNNLLVVFLILFLFGCAPNRSSSLQPQIDSASGATLKMSQKYLGIRMIDGVDSMTFSEFLWTGMGYPRTYIVSPGKHTILAINGKNYQMRLWIVAEQGKEYLLKIRCLDGNCQMWFVDTSTGATVGGLVGSDDEPK